MRPTIVTLFLIAALIVLEVDESSAWLFWGRSRRKPSGGHGSKPYYFGTTSLLCMSSKGKRAPSRFTLSPTHRWIYFDGYYFERLKTEDIYGKKPDSSDRCSTEREDSPAGYSKLSVQCIKKCTDKYRQKYGGYNLFFNNCHYFANRISKILHDSTTCPSWCG